MNTDLNLLRSSVTVLSLLLFLVLVAWTWHRSRRGGFDDAAQLPFTAETAEQDAGTTGAERT